MSDGQTNTNLQKGGRYLAFAIASVLGLILLVIVALWIYLATPLPAPQLSRFVTSYLQQRFTVQKIEISGQSLTLKGVRLENPAGFRSPDLAVAEAVTIAPRWLDLVGGRQRFQVISIQGGRVYLERNSAGIWNYTLLQQRLAAKQAPAARKRPPPETVVGKLLVRDSAVYVEGQGVQGINLQVYNLTSGGSRQAQVELAFEDAARNRYLLKGTARPGADAAVDLSLTAAPLYLKKVATLLKLKNPVPLENARGTLQVNAVLVKGELRSSGTFTFAEVQLPAAKGSYPVAGTLQFSGVYDSADDTANLDEATLTIDKVAQLHADGSVTGVRKERRFALLLGLDQVDLTLLNVLLSHEARKGLLLGGSLRCESLRLEGSQRAGLESAAGILQIKEGSLARDGEVLLSGLAGKMGLSRKGNAVVAQGRFSVTGPQPQAAVQRLDLPLELTLSPQMKPVRAQSNNLSATVMGISLAGRLSYDTGSDEPVAASLRIIDGRLPSLNTLLKRYDLQASSGSATGTLELAGKSGQDLHASARLQLSDFSGKRGKDSLGAKDAALTAQLQRRGGRWQGDGEARLAGLTLNGKKGDARFAYRVADDMLFLEGVQAKLAETRLSAARFSMQLPPSGVAARGGRSPLQMDVAGGALKQGELGLDNISGRMRGMLATEGKERWLEGAAELSSGVSWQGKGLGAPVLQATFSRPGGRAVLSGQLLGGKVTGQAALQPFAPQAGASFQLAVTGAALAQAGRFIPSATALRPTDGQLDLRLNGAYSGKEGLSCRFESKGRGIALGSNGKTRLSGAALSLTGKYAAGNLSIAEAVLTPGKGVALQVKGDVARALTPKRQGILTISLPETPLNALVDATINLVPPTVQEATLSGTVAAGGRFELREGRQLLEGGINIRGGRLEVASQKLAVTDINGRVPVSFDFAGKGSAQPREAREFSRENYPRLLVQLRDIPSGGETVSVGKISFGTLEMGKLTMQLRAANGLMELTSMRTTLYEGALLGTGYLSMRGKPTYRMDLLVNGLSMRTLCRTIPNLEGYISGRVDGITSIRGVGGGLAGISGFVDLWAREGAGEKMLVSKEFLQRLAKQKLSGFFLSRDRPYDEAEIKATLQEGDLTFNTLKIVNTNVFGVRDLNVNIAPTQNRIALDHLLESIKEAAVRGKPATGEPQPAKAPAKQEAVPEFKWEE